jgi:hypothetical protein
VKFACFPCWCLLMSDGSVARETSFKFDSGRSGRSKLRRSPAMTFAQLLSNRVHSGYNDARIFEGPTFRSINRPRCSGRVVAFALWEEGIVNFCLNNACALCKLYLSRWSRPNSPSILLTATSHTFDGKGPVFIAKSGLIMFLAMHSGLTRQLLP